MLSDFKIPHNISLGQVALGSSKTQTLQLKSGIPVDFQFTLTPVKPNPAISVSPLSGSLCGDEPLGLNVTFEPNDFSTALAVYRVHCSQYNFEPYDVTISGFSRPGAVKEDELAKTAHGSELLQTAKVEAMTVGNQRGAGAGAAFDPGVSLLERSLARSKMKVAAREAQQLAAEAAAKARGEGDLHELLLEGDGEAFVDGLRVPAELSGQAAANYLLTQAEGKLKPKDIPVAVAAHRSIMKQQQAALEATSSTVELKPRSAGPHLSRTQVLSLVKAASWAVRAAVWAGGLGFSQRSKQGIAQSDARRAHMAALRAQLQAAQQQQAALSPAQRAMSARTWNASLGKTSRADRSARLSIVQLDERIKSLQGALLKEEAVLQAEIAANAAAGRGDFDVDVPAMLEAIENTPPGKMHALEQAVDDLARHGSVRLEEASGATLAGCTSPYAARVAAALDSKAKASRSRSASSDAPHNMDEGGEGGGDAGAAIAAVRSRDAGADDSLTLRRSLLSTTVAAIRTAEQDRRTLSKVKWLGEPQWPEEASLEVQRLRMQLSRLEQLITTRAAARQSHTTLHGGEVSQSWIAHKTARAPVGPVTLVLPPSGVPHGLQDAQQRAQQAQEGMDDAAAAAEVAARRASVDCLRDLFATRLVRDRAARRLASLRRRLAHVWRIAGNDTAARRAAVQDLVQKDEQHAAASRDASSTWVKVQPSWLPPSALVPVPPKARAAGGDASAQGTQLILGKTILPKVQEFAIQPVPDADTDALTVSAASAPGAFSQAQQRTKEAFKAGAITAQHIGPQVAPPKLPESAQELGIEAPTAVSGADLWPVLQHVSHTGAAELPYDALAIAVAHATGVTPLQVMTRRLQLQAEQHSGAAEGAATQAAAGAKGGGTLTALRASSTVIGQPASEDASAQAAMQALHRMGGITHNLQHTAACDVAAWWSDDDVTEFDMQPIQPAILLEAKPVPMSLIPPTPPLCLGQPLRAGASHADDLNASLSGVVTSCLQPAAHGDTAVPQPPPGLICSHRFALQAVHTLRCAAWDAAAVLPDMRWVNHSPIAAAHDGQLCKAMTPGQLQAHHITLRSGHNSAGLLRRLAAVLGDLGQPALRQWLAPPGGEATQPTAPQPYRAVGTPRLAGLECPVQDVQRPSGLSCAALLGAAAARASGCPPPVPLSIWEGLLQLARGGLPSAGHLQLAVLDANSPGDVDSPNSSVTAAFGSLRYTVLQRWRGTGVLLDGIRLCPKANTGHSAQIHMDASARRELHNLLPASDDRSGPSGTPSSSDDVQSHGGLKTPVHPLLQGCAFSVHETACGASLVHSGSPLLPSCSAPPPSVAQSLLQPATQSFPYGTATPLQRDPLNPLQCNGVVCTRGDAVSGTFGCAVALGGACDVGMWQGLSCGRAASSAEVDWSAPDTWLGNGVMGELDVNAIGQASLPSDTCAWLEGGADSNEGGDSSEADTDAALLPDILQGMQPTAASGGLVMYDSLGEELQQMLQPAAEAPLGWISTPPRMPGYLGACWRPTKALAVHADRDLSDDSESDSESLPDAAESMPALHSLALNAGSSCRLRGIRGTFPQAAEAACVWPCNGHIDPTADSLMGALRWHRVGAAAGADAEVSSNPLSPFAKMLLRAVQQQHEHTPKARASQELLSLQEVVHVLPCCCELPGDAAGGDLPLPPACRTCPSASQRMACWWAFLQFIKAAAALGLFNGEKEGTAEGGGAGETKTPFALRMSQPGAQALLVAKRARHGALVADLPGPLFAPWAARAAVQQAQAAWFDLAA